MAGDEQIFAATRLAISPEALPVNTLPKKIRWKHLDGSFALILSTVSSKIRLQLKQNGKPIITTTLNKLTPGQKKNVSAPRLQYQDQRMSFRYPSSSQVDNGLSERFQITLDEISSVQTVVQKLTPFFSIIAPSTSTTSSQIATGSQIGKKRPATEVGAPAAGGNKRRATAMPRAEVAESQVESQGVVASIGCSTEMPSAKVPEAFTTLAPSNSPPEHVVPSETELDHCTSAKEKEPPLMNPSTDLPADGNTQAAESGLSSFKAGLLQGYTTPDTQTHDTQSQSLNPARHISNSFTAASPPKSSPVPPPIPNRQASDTQLSTQAPQTQPAPQSSSSTDQVSQEIDLLPRSPLVDTSSPPYCPARKPSLQQDTLTSLPGLTFGVDEKELEGLKEAFPPMRTAQEEADERGRRRREEEEWEEELVDQAAEIDINATREIQTIFGADNFAINLSALDRIAPQVAFTDEELYTAISKGQLSYELLDMCYRITAMSTRFQQHQYQPAAHFAEPYRLGDISTQPVLQVGYENGESTFIPSSPSSPLPTSPIYGRMIPISSTSPFQVGHSGDHLQYSSPSSPDYADYRLPAVSPHLPRVRDPHYSLYDQSAMQETPHNVHCQDPSIIYSEHQAYHQDRAYEYDYEYQYNHEYPANIAMEMEEEEIDDIDD